MRVPNFAPLSCARKKRFNEIFPWIVALDAFDHCDPDLLRKLLLADDPIPAEARRPLADIVSGRRKPNKKAAAKLKIPAGERMKIAGSLSVLLGLIDILKYENIGDGEGQIRPAIEIVAERRRLEPIDELRRLEAVAKSVVEDTASQIGVSTESVENLLRTLRKKLADFPNV
jgi:hypothetical protein